MREEMGCSCRWVLLTGFALMLSASFCGGETDSGDVMAMNNLYISLGYPPLRGWILVGGDPCGEMWQGIDCVFSNITAIKLSGSNLGGELGESLQFLRSVMHIDFSNNHIGGVIPPALPPTLTNLSLSGNLLTGNIPDTLSTLSQLLELSLDNNRLVGPIPDAFLQFTTLTRLDLSNNNLSGELPPSMGSLISLSSLHLQSNQLGGVLDVLQDLPLQDLDIENNLFSGPIPIKLEAVPIFRKDGNPFNTSVILTPEGAPTPSPVWASSPNSWPWNTVHPPSNELIETPGESKKFLTAKAITWITVAGISVVIALLMCLLLPRLFRARRRSSLSKDNQFGAHKSSTEQPKHDASSVQHSNQMSASGLGVPKEERIGINNRRTGITPKPLDGRVMHTSAQSSMSMKDNEIDVTDTDDDILLPPPPPPSFPSSNISSNNATASGRPSKQPSLNSLRAFTVASLQQYTNSFSQENFIGDGALGSVYSAEFPNGELLEVKKLDNKAVRQTSDEGFLELVSSISKLRHANIVEIVGYCMEHGQRLLVYKCCVNGTLHDGLHTYDEVHQKLSWNRRIHVALGAARALEYLHEVCKPRIVHRNFRSCNLLLDDKLEVHVADCGLSPLLSMASIFERLNANGYGAPEFELGNYTYQSDVYCFGVVLLELLTGRKAYDSSRPRSEQFLVRWAIPKLHDIDSLARMVDTSLYGAYSMKSLSRFADIISSCIQREPEFRPPISEIVREIQQVV